MLELQEIKPQTIVVKKFIESEGGGHHGGAWKVAYADFVTAMMAFFMLMWIIGATSEDQRKGIADYFRPTLATQSAGGGANGILAGRSMRAKDGIAASAAQSIAEIVRQIDTIARVQSDGGPGASGAEDSLAFLAFQKHLLELVIERPELAAVADQIQLYETPEGLRLEIADSSDTSMFGIGNAEASAPALIILAAVTESLGETANMIAIRGHTDARAYANPALMNNWLLSAARADAIRRIMLGHGLGMERVARIEGSADREPRQSSDPYDDRNRRISITLLYAAHASSASGESLMPKSAPLLSTGSKPSPLTP